MIILGHHYVTILLPIMLILAPFSQSMCTFYFCINPWLIFIRARYYLWFRWFVKHKNLVIFRIFIWQCVQISSSNFVQVSWWFGVGLVCLLLRNHCIACLDHLFYNNGSISVLNVKTWNDNNHYIFELLDYVIRKKNEQFKSKWWKRMGSWPIKEDRKQFNWKIYYKLFKFKWKFDKITVIWVLGSSARCCEDPATSSCPREGISSNRKWSAWYTLSFQMQKHLYP